MTGSHADELAIRPPRQQRSRETWRRILDAGVALLEDEGYDGFTIAGVCARAGAAPPAVYARTTSKEALFLAVYEHGADRLRRDQTERLRSRRDPHADPEGLVRAAVEEVVGLALRHGRFLRAVVLLSAAHAEVRRRGSENGRALGEQFAVAVLDGARHAVRHEDPVAAVRTCFVTVFSATMIRIAYGADFATAHPVGDDAFVRDQADTAVQYLLARPPGRPGPG